MEENRSGFRGEERDKITAWLVNILHRRNSLIKIHDPLYFQITRAEVTHWGRTPLDRSAGLSTGITFSLRCCPSPLDLG